MKMTNEDKSDLALEAMFQSAREGAGELEPAFLARLTLDADTAISELAVESGAQIETPSLWARITAALVPASGLAAATLAGVWIGFQVPSTALADGLTFDDTADFDVSAFLPAVALSGFSEEEVDG